MRTNSVGQSIHVAILAVFSLSLISARTVCAETSAQKAGSGIHRQAEKNNGQNENEVYRSAETVNIINREQVEATGPVAGSGQALSIAPGVTATGYGTTGSTPDTVSINGIKLGGGE